MSDLKSINPVNNAPSVPNLTLLINSLSGSYSSSLSNSVGPPNKSPNVPVPAEYVIDVLYGQLPMMILSRVSCPKNKPFAHKYEKWHDHLSML